MASKRTCEICGKGPFKNVHGLKVHTYRAHSTEGKNQSLRMAENQSGKKKRAPYGSKKKLQQVPATTSKLAINVPCNLGGNPFNVEIELSIAGTAIRPL
jgi:hypothetical protein